MWKIEINKQSDKFLENNTNEIKETVFSKIRIVRDWLENKNALTVDFKRLKGEYKNMYRIRTGKIRVIVILDKENKILRIHNIDFRGSVY